MNHHLESYYSYMPDKLHQTFIKCNATEILYICIVGMILNVFYMESFYCIGSGVKLRTCILPVKLACVHRMNCLNEIN